MKAINDTDAWRTIPPEVKLELMNRSHARGIAAAAGMILLAASVAIGLQMPWIFWGSFFLSPVIFQIISGKAWRRVKPQTVLRYLAARSAARRYAFTANANDLQLHLIMEGKLERIYNPDEEAEIYDSESIPDIKPKDVWIVVFADVVVMLEERRGGARVAFISLLDENLNISSDSPDGEEYSRNKAILLSLHIKSSDSQIRYRVTSKYPGALIVCEKKMLELKKRLAELKEKMRQPPVPAPQNELLEDHIIF